MSLFKIWWHYKDETLYLMWLPDDAEKTIVHITTIWKTRMGVHYWGLGEYVHNRSIWVVKCFLHLFRVKIIHLSEKAKHIALYSQLKLSRIAIGTQFPENNDRPLAGSNSHTSDSNVGDHLAQPWTPKWLFSILNLHWRWIRFYI